jgi:hypothetical protein
MKEILEELRKKIIVLNCPCCSSQGNVKINTNYISSRGVEFMTRFEISVNCSSNKCLLHETSFPLEKWNQNAS